MQVLVGDWVGRDVAVSQPVKLAALEGLAHTTKGAPEHLLGWYENEKVKYGIEIPKLLSLLAYHNPEATVAGLDTVPKDRQPPINVVRISFQTMVGIGPLLALLGVWLLAVRIIRYSSIRAGWPGRAPPQPSVTSRTTVVHGHEE